MEKKIIKIFLASSITELRNERNELESFLRKIGGRLCERFVEKGIYFNIEPIRCEDVDPAYAEGRAQDVLNHLLENCEVCVFLFFTQAGEYTLEEFNAALAAFRTSGGAKPKIYTFFKKTEEGEVAQSVKDFMVRLDKDLQHYYPFFDSIDTVKLQLLLHLSVLNSDFMEVAFDDGACYVNGEKELDVSHVSQFANNQVLQEFIRELATIEAEYYPMKGGYPYEDEETNRKYRKLAERRQFLKETIEQLQKEIFDMTLTICKDEASGKEITVRMREAYRLFEQGDLDGANRILNYAEIKDEYLRRKKIRADEQKKDDALYVRELRAKIKFLLADVKNAGRFAEIEEIFTDAVAVAKESLVEVDVLYDFAYYLDDQGKSARAYEVAKELETIYESGDVAVEPSEKRSLWWVLSIICGHLSSKVSEYAYYTVKALECYEALAAANPERYNADLAMSYNNAGNFYHNQGQPAKAEEYYLKAIALYEALAAANPERYNADLAMSYNNASVFFADQGQPAKAEAYYLKAIALRESLAAANPERYNADLTMSYNNVGIFYADQGQPAKAEEYYLKAIALRESLAAANPERYNADLAMSYNNVGIFYADQGQPVKAEAYHLKAIALYEALAAANPERYNADLAASYGNVGILYNNQRQPAKAEAYYLKAIALRESLAVANPERYNAGLATSYYNVAIFYGDQGQPAKAEAYYLKAIALREALAAANPERYNAGLASVYWNYAALIYSKEFFTKAYRIAKQALHDPRARRIVEMYEQIFAS